VGAFLRQGAELWHETLDRKGRKMTTKALTTTKKQPPTAQDSVRPIVHCQRHQNRQGRQVGWAWEAGITQGCIVLRIHKGGYVNGDSMSAQAVADVVREYAERCGFGSLAKTSTS
jgi:hypothetical protein